MAESIQSLLQEVWDICKRARVVDDREIIEYIAALLLEMKGIEPLNQDLQPHRPPTRYGIDEEELTSRLREAGTEIDNDFGKLFDNYVLFQSSRTAQRGSYPIPRHIITFMLEMLDIRPEKSFADFACGSGGFLVHSYQQKHSAVSRGQMVGVDIAPAWARIAVANVSLNGLPKESTEIYSDDAFHICGPGGVLKNQQFDYIAMAPSFGRVSNEKTATDAFEKGTVGSNETLFTRLMVEKLRRSGKGIMMVPNGLLSRTADRALRKMLVEGHTLRAVISLKAGMLYPFNDEQVGLILVQKQPLPTPPQTWFFRAEQDGYSLTRSRDVTKVPSQASDMPLIAAAMNHTTIDYYHIPLKQHGNTTNMQALRIKWLSRSKGQDFLGMLVQIAEQAEVISIRLVNKPAEKRNYLVAEVNVVDQNTTFIILPLAQKSVSQTGTAEQFSSRDECIEKLYAPDTPNFNEIPDPPLFRNGKSGQLLVFSPDGRLLGVSKTRLAIAEPEYNLHPDQYILAVETKEPESSELYPEKISSTGGPAGVALTEIKKRQAIIRDYADNLLGRVEMKPLIGEQLPPHIAPSLLSDGYCTFIPLFDTRQERIWKHICSHQSYQEQALYFTSDDLQEHLEAAQPDEDKVDSVSIQQTLDLLVRLGLIVHVIMRDPGTGTVKRYYRLVTEQDQPVPIKESESR